MMFNEEVFEKYDKLLWKRVHKKMSQQDKKVTWRITADDLHSEAVIAMMNACEKFDESRGNQFSTYLTTAVDHQLDKYLREHSRAFSINQDVNNKVKVVTKMLNSGMTQSEIAEELGITEKELAEILATNLNSYSLDYKISIEDGNDMPFDAALIVEEEEPTKPKDELEIALATIKNCTIVSEEDKIQYMRYRGIFGYDKATLGQLAQETGMTTHCFRSHILEVASIIEHQIRMQVSIYRDLAN